MPANVSGLTLGYISDWAYEFQANLTGGRASLTSTGNLASSKIVITGIDMESAYDGFALSWIETAGTGGFDMAQHTVDPGVFQAAAANEGAQGRVITAVSWNSDEVYYISYGWQGDPSTVYETQVATATLASIGSVASNLASQGYILTAIGGTYANGILIVGTRVKGDIMARPVMLIPNQQSPEPLLLQGYAIVALVEDPNGYPYWIGER